jgi:hypothetical protein
MFFDNTTDRRYAWRHRTAPMPNGVKILGEVWGFVTGRRH